MQLPAVPLSVVFMQQCYNRHCSLWLYSYGQDFPGNAGVAPWQGALLHTIKDYEAMHFPLLHRLQAVAYIKNVLVEKPGKYLEIKRFLLHMYSVLLYMKSVHVYMKSVHVYMKSVHVYMKSVHVYMKSVHVYIKSVLLYKNSLYMQRQSLPLCQKPKHFQKKELYAALFP
ncbi:MAG TPA: hypothetical protein PL009_12250 [Flavipsychrobacter sp.]|nr:hypothetical protein [Flavipsychrobacter sp.]